MNQYITQEQYEAISKEYNILVSLIKAVEAVESNGNGFIADNILKILFEAHIFSRLTKGKYDKTNLDISSLRWNRKLYKGGKAEYLRLEKAANLDYNSALQSASWGSFQIMGFNFKSCGFENVEDFVKFLSLSLYNNLVCFIRYCNSRKLLNHLRALDFKTFARLYNGLGFAKNKYDIKLEQAYKRYSYAV